MKHMGKKILTVRSAISIGLVQIYLKQHICIFSKWISKPMLSKTEKKGYHLQNKFALLE